MGIGVVLAAVAGLAGCNNPESATFQEPIQSFHDAYADYSANFVYMADNAMLHDMSINDAHFIPHTSELSGTGVARLIRFARLLNTYGGTVRYETFEPDAELVTERMGHVREFLASADCNMERVAVRSMMSGGRGARAIDAIGAMNRGTADSIEAAMAGNSQTGGSAGAGAGAGSGS
ncbi:MAG: hypothetical protein C4547_14120 [Phycisphaerales bacterium]|nr:MAG: hypothetical protein C4547_14120 [Phycisphaerales bacterium]